MHDVWYSYVNVGGEAVYSNYISIYVLLYDSKRRHAGMGGGMVCLQVNTPTP